MIHIFRGNPRAEHRRKLLKDSACQLARGSHLVNFLRCLDWDHATISALTSSKTNSPARLASTRANIPSSLVKVCHRNCFLPVLLHPVCQSADVICIGTYFESTPTVWTPIVRVANMSSDADHLSAIGALTCSNCGKVISLGRHVQEANEPCPNCGGKLEVRNDDNLGVLARRMKEYERKLFR